MNLFTFFVENGPARYLTNSILAVFHVLTSPACSAPQNLASDTTEAVEEAVNFLNKRSVDRHPHMTKKNSIKNYLHKQRHHVASLLISLCVIQTHSAAHDLCSQANFHHILGTRLKLLSHFGQQVTH